MNATLPALPKIEGHHDIILDLYSHHSLKGNNVMNEEYGDVERLAELGRNTLDLVLVAHAFQKRPMLLADHITDYAREAVSDHKLKEWLTFYNIKSSFHAAPGSCDILESPEEMRKFFTGYVGALYLRNGLNHVQAWISALVDPDANASSFGSPPPSMGMPPPPLGAAPPLPPSNSGPLAITLSMVNQTAMQKGVSVTYPAQQIGGPSHAPIWKVECHMNGTKRGEGTGKNQKQAKEEAGRQAYRNMGW
ncbi:hypothetical protein C8F04DRAFT_1083655 [Mycena alexandri]|uniref:Uncharacterized protein n=1 Tax=Mycena alexandri TaxID=1745969 RepID=A0AAD6T8N6_9AGAR|nr:hypothetical protein C8F04DRAFT_1083655 [Mycena alexandri]